MKKLTLDTNCIIGLEQDESTSADIQAIIRAHDQGRLNVAIPAIMASERQRDGRRLEHFDQFRARLAGLGLDSVDLIEPIAYFGIGFYDHGLLADDSMVLISNAASTRSCIQQSLSDLRTSAKPTG